MSAVESYRVHDNYFIELSPFEMYKGNIREMNLNLTGVTVISARLEVQVLSGVGSMWADYFFNGEHVVSLFWDELEGGVMKTYSVDVQAWLINGVNKFHAQSVKEFYFPFFAQQYFTADLVITYDTSGNPPSADPPQEVTPWWTNLAYAAIILGGILAIGYLIRGRSYKERR